MENYNDTKEILYLDFKKLVGIGKFVYIITKQYPPVVLSGTKETIKKFVNTKYPKWKPIKVVIDYIEPTSKDCYTSDDMLIENDITKQEEVEQLKQQLLDEERAHDLCIDRFNEECEKLRKQIKFESDARERFKQSQNQKAIEVLEKLKNNIWDLNIGDYYLQNGGLFENIKVKRAEVYELIDNQIKELRSEE